MTIAKAAKTDVDEIAINIVSYTHSLMTGTAQTKRKSHAYDHNTSIALAHHSGNFYDHFYPYSRLWRD